jgi:uncharacterized membrane protein
MKISSIFRSITIPAKRKPFRWFSLLVPIIFLCILGGVYLYLELEHILIFTRPAWFILLVLTPWFWWQFEAGSSGLYGFRAILAQFIRLAIFAIFVMLLAEPRAVRESKALNVMYVLDVSDSIGTIPVNKASDYIVKTAHGRPEKDKAGLIIFGKDAAVEYPPRTTELSLDQISSRIRKDNTDIARALSLTNAMLPEDENGRIILISDGTATTGSLNDVLDELSAKKIPVDVLPIQYDFKNEVWLEKLELPKIVKQGETYEASLLLSSLTSGSGMLVLEENGQEIFTKKILYKAGKNRYTLPIYLREPGYYEYAAKIIADHGADGWKKNNIAVNSIYLRGKGKILLVTDSAGEKLDWELMEKALKESGFIVEVKDALDFPRDSMSLMPYDCIIFVNVPADLFDSVQFRAVKSAVYNQGTGFMMVGGKNSFGPGGYNRTDIEQILPVDMDITNKKVLPKGALAIILHTCEFPDGNRWAKDISIAALKVLGPNDEVGLLAYDYKNGEDWIFPLTPAKEFNKLVKKINQCNPGDMPSFINTMKLGLEGLKKSDAAAKHMIIISDGDPQPPPPSLIAKFKAAHISISTVLVDGFHQGGFRKVMHLIASSTGGRFYYPQNPKRLPAIFIKEATTLKRSMIQNNTFTPRIEYNDGALLKDITSFPKLHGYVLTSAKDDSRRCRVILRGVDKDQMDPVLAVGQFGIGKTAAFTSDLSSNWGRDWVEWDKYQPLLKQLILRISRVSKEGSLRMRAFNSGNYGMVVVEDFNPQAEFLEMMAAVIGPDNKKIEIKLHQDGLRRYSAKFPLWGKGRYEIVAAALGENREERAVGSFVIPYSAEYLRFRSNPIALREIAKRTNGKILKGTETGSDLFPEKRKVIRSSKPIFDLFLILLACLIPLDVGVRRIQLDFYAIRNLFASKKKKESTATLGALLQRKQKNSADFNATRQEVRSFPKQEKSTKTVPEPTRKTAGENIEKRESKIESGDDIPESTTGRLLAKKRNRK